MRSKLGAGILAGVLATVPYGLIVSAVRSPPMGDAGATAPMGGMDGGMDGGDASAGEPMIRMVAGLAGSDSLAVAWILLLAAGAGMGLLFGALFGGRPASRGGWLLRGLLYGAAWWVAGGLVLMPVLLGMPALSPLTMEMQRTAAAVGLAAYLTSGLVLGTVFPALHGAVDAAD